MDLEEKWRGLRIRGFTENSRIEKARTPIRRRMKRERTFPKACLKVAPLEVSESAIDGQLELWGSARLREWQRWWGGKVGSGERGFCRSLEEKSDWERLCSREVDLLRTTKLPLALNDNDGSSYAYRNDKDTLLFFVAETYWLLGGASSLVIDAWFSTWCDLIGVTFVILRSFDKLDFGPIPFCFFRRISYTYGG